jgi:cyanophycinase
MSARQGAVGTLALIGGGEFREGCQAFDAELLAAAGTKDVVVLPTAAAFENPQRVVERATSYFEGLGAKVKPLMVLHRAEAEDPKTVEAVRRAHLVYIADGSPLHLRSVLKASLLAMPQITSFPTTSRTRRGPEISGTSSWRSRSTGRSCTRGAFSRITVSGFGTSHCRSMTPKGAWSACCLRRSTRSTRRRS